MSVAWEQVVYVLLPLYEEEVFQNGVQGLFILV